MATKFNVGDTVDSIHGTAIVRSIRPNKANPDRNVYEVYLIGKQCNSSYYEHRLQLMAPVELSEDVPW